MFVKVTMPVVRALTRKDIIEDLGEDGVEAILNYYDEIANFEGESSFFDQSMLTDWTRYNSILDAASSKGLSFSQCKMETRELYEGAYWNEMTEEEKEEAVIDYMRERLIESYECIVLKSGAVVII